MTIYKVLSSAILTTLFMALVSCNNEKPSEAASAEVEVLPENIVELRADQIKLARIETGSMELRSMSGTLKVNGIVSVAPQNIATVCMPMGGFIKSTSLMPGNRVSKGQTLAIVENQDFVDVQQSFLEARSKLEFAQAEYERHNELYKEDVYSKQSVQQVTADYKTLKAQVKALEQKLALIGIHSAELQEDNITRTVAVSSPISGYVKAVHVNVGKYVSPTDVLFEIINNDQLFLELTLFEKDAVKVATGQKIHFLTNNGTEQHEAVINQMGKSVDADKTYKVYARVTGTIKNILPGMYVSALIETSGNRVTALPSEAIVRFDDKEYIFVFAKDKVENGKAFTEYRMVEVQKGVTDGDYTEIIVPQGINPQTDKIVTKGAYNLLSAKKNAGEMSC